MQYLTIIPIALVGYDMVDKPTRRVNRFLKNAHKLSRIVPDFICKDNRFSACFSFWADAYSCRIWRAWYSASYTMMAKLIRAPELRYLMIQFVINKFIRLTKGSVCTGSGRYCIVSCLPMRHSTLEILRSNGSLEMLVVEERGKPDYPEKNVRSKWENKQQTKPIDTGTWIRASLEGGECFHHCATLAHRKQNKPKEKIVGRCFFCEQKFYCCDSLYLCKFDQAPWSPSDQSN